VSEYGKLCAKFPEKAREVRSGAFNTVQAGQRITIESTAEGQAGHFYELTQKAQQKTDAGTPLTALDFKFHFAPWWTSEEYVLHEDVTITTEFAAYFEDLEVKHKVFLTDAQKAWYVKKEEQQGEDMKREYPSTPQEAFEASIEGAYFGTEMRKMFWQDHGFERRAIDYYENSGEGFNHYAAVLNRKGYNYSRHYMPHDADQRSLTDIADTRKMHAERTGIKPIEVLKRIDTEQSGIDASRAFLAKVWMDEERCSRLIACLDNYRKAWDDKLGQFKSYALHDEFSHGYKSFESAAIRPEKSGSGAMDLNRLKRGIV
jgi:hypothetical protein